MAYTSKALELYASGYIGDPLDDDAAVINFLKRLHKAPGDLDYIHYMASDDYNVKVAAAYGALKYEKNENVRTNAQDILKSVDPSCLDPLVLALYVDHECSLGNFENAMSAIVDKEALGRSLKTSTLLQMNQHSQAHDYIMEQTSINYSCPATLVSSAFVALYQQNYSEAQESFQEAEKSANVLKRDGSCFSDIICNGLATVYMSQQKWNEAKNLLLKALKINENNGNVLANLVTCFLNLREIQRATEYYKRLCAFSNHPLVVNTRAIEQHFEFSELH
ncbi:bifunctional Tetratricopeptide-like helical domain superfamily/Tetratricopeptide repeat/Coatomer [Babesia duncani]|uniref:Bifunctional Tetratricopeptide-like helical domain superfamily/Tetratricopeptide repeat/Coatomer n=1 Tax=Babesia duncani TaxID=323732 RepID=A0AAD9UMU9_9APIC|nr:bifunctional Tetratricopeptide-like helical domain superfamily/Tetratricopeptide repeat/Coatomer [Babesia duncani]